jgi:hypothetical protein
MATGNENTIKLIYSIQDITLMLIFNMSGAWSTDHDRTFRGSHRDHDKGEIDGNGNALGLIQRNGNCMITGDADTLRHCETFGGWA